MDKREDPYSPGAGRAPFALTGRAQQTEDFETAVLRIESGLDARPLAFYGLRGVGKTVLLRSLYEKVKARKWITAIVEGRPGKDLRSLIGEELEEVLADLAKPKASQTVLKAVKTALSFLHLQVNTEGAFSLGLDLSSVDSSNAATGNIAGDFGRVVRDLSFAAEKSNTGVALFFDEAQEMSTEDLQAINTLAHRASQERYRLVLAIAGLPTLPGILAESNSYVERLYAYHELGPLSAEATAAALTEPAAFRNVEWTDGAIDFAVRATGGFSYFVQEFGSASWASAKASPINLKDARRADRLAQESLDTGFFKSRWTRATDAQKAYLQAMSLDGEGPSTTAGIAARLGKEPTALSPRRAELITKGLIYSPRQGAVAFTVPKMADFIKRQVTD
ncbi:MAG: ATP-binding protein [Coriobacteriales bacterium]|jgi:type II secretory pathway predicted ATPase ExeA|nr:ATP-binding protein [Coriobacteriales bacterium]